MRKSSFHPACLSFPLIEPLEPSSLAKLSANLRNRLIFSGPWSFQLRLRSSFIVTSSTQCKPFSIPQCARATSVKRVALPAPVAQGRGVDPLAAEDRANSAGVGGTIGLGENTQLVPDGERPAAGAGR